ncbi:MAG: hypothetical protein P8Y45_21150, partial [Exilibacterium sp.]
PKRLRFRPPEHAPFCPWPRRSSYRGACHASSSLPLSLKEKGEQKLTHSEDLNLKRFGYIDEDLSVAGLLVGTH